MRSRKVSGRSRTSERGIAIIMAILIVALAASAAAFAAWQQSLWIRQTENRVSQAQAQAVIGAAIDFGRAVLAKDLEDPATAQTDHLEEPWAKYALSVPVEGGQVEGKIEDLQGRYNLNNVAANNQSVLVLQRLLRSLDLPAELAAAVRDWIDPDDTTEFPGGAEDLDYLSRPEPYRTARQAIIDVEELYYVKGFDDEIMKKLRPFVTALPVVQGGVTPINVNTAPKEVLTALFDDVKIAEKLIELREQSGPSGGPFKTPENFSERTRGIVPQPETGKGDGKDQTGRETAQAENPPGQQQPPADDQQNPKPPGGNSPGTNPPGTNPPGANPPGSGTPQFGVDYGITSNYFLVSARSQFGNVRQGVQALVQRSGQGFPRVVMQRATLN